ncbi:MAG: hypothetical protein ACK5ET_08735 [Ignavibacteria bacterium]|jgi:hypothetical protein
MRLIIFTITTFLISCNIVTADTLIEQLKKCKPKVKTEYPEYRDVGTQISTYACGLYRFSLEQRNTQGEICSDHSYGHEFTFTAERKESKKGKYKPFQFSDLFQTEKVGDFNKILQDSIQKYIQTSEYKTLIQDNPIIQGINECGYLFSKGGIIVIYNIGIDWEKAAKFIMKRDSIDDYDQAYMDAVRNMCGTGSCIVNWEKMGEYLRE